MRGKIVTDEHRKAQSEGMKAHYAANPQRRKADSDRMKKFCAENYPARQYGLIMWDHGGGAIDGYGYDEKYIDGNLTLMDMKQAFQYAGLDKNKLSFLGFDTCLMATVEMAAVAADYAEVMIASEDLEPGGGWNYEFLTVFNENPYAGGAEIGVRAVDEFVEFYGEDTDEILSLSVIDLSRVSPVLGTMGELMRPCSQSLIVNSRSSFRTLADHARKEPD